MVLVHFVPFCGYLIFSHEKAQNAQKMNWVASEISHQAFAVDSHAKYLEATGIVNEPDKDQSKSFALAVLKFLPRFRGGSDPPDEPRTRFAGTR